jgi:molecular chaperone GrpE
MAERPPAAEAAAGAPEPTPAAVQEEAGADGTTPAPAPQADPATAEEDTDPAAALAAAQAAAAANEDKFLRARADLENYRRRVIRERAEVARDAKKEVLLRVLDVLDNLERALGYEQAGDQVDAQALLMGLRMTVTQFEDVLSGLGVKAVAACGEQFDPRWHEAVATVVDPAQAEGTIVEEIQRGYHLADALLRPARVKVVAGPSETA